MILFEYSGSQRNGKIVRKRLWAEDRSDLIRRLEEEEMFLISAHEIQEGTDQTRADAPAAPEPESRGWYRSPLLGIGKRRVPRSIEITALLCSVLVAVFLFHSLKHMLLKQDPVVASTMDFIRNKAPIGTPRGEVESTLTHRMLKPSTSALTLYREPPDLIYEVPYDSTGGPWSSSNRVNGMVIIRRSSPGHTNKVLPGA